MSSASLQINVYGIRHHGPGSARALLRALERQPPDVLAIEMPADLQDSIGILSHADLQPPVALAAFEPERVEPALYYPLAAFSPEWVAMRFCVERGIPIQAMDLPATLMIGFGQREQAKRRAANTNSATASAPELNRDQSAAELQKDPLGVLAALAGYTDTERWWERTFELTDSDERIFPAVLDMIRALREAFPWAVNAECALREQHMARTIVGLAKAGHQRIAVLCGAWHAPALVLSDAKDPLSALKKLAGAYSKSKADLKGPKLTSTWIPWTYERLRTGSGYGAGVRSPVWYDLLFEDSSLATEHYLTLLARELRLLGGAASTAQIIDAVDLADALRAIRGLELAGLDEIREAALGALAQGGNPLLDTALLRIESNRRAGRVPEHLRALPLLVDLEKRLKELRLLSTYREMEPVERELDLRKAAHLATSQLLHQLALLDIPFGVRLPGKTQALGTFRELWALHWKPEFTLALIPAHRFGHLIADAARAALRESLDAEADLLQLAKAVDLILGAGLFEGLDEIAGRIRTQAAQASDVWMLARILPEFLRLSRYPSLRVQDVGTLDGLNDVILPKLAAGLALASRGIDEEAARLGFTHLRLLQSYAGMLDESLHTLWLAALRQVAYDAQAHPLLMGFALRTLADAQDLGAVALQRRFAQQLAPGGQIDAAADFLEGFLYSSAQVLLHEPELLSLLDVWLAVIPLDTFRDLLPALRRTFAQFGRSERRKLFAQVARMRRDEEAAIDITSRDSQRKRSVDQLSPKPALAPQQDWPELEAFLISALAV